MVLKTVVFALLSIASLGSAVIAQVHLSYGDAAGPFVDFPTNLAIDSQGDSVIIGYGERFDLPPGQVTLDSVDFIADSISADSNFVDLFPVITSQTSNGPELLPDWTNTNASKRLNPVSINPVSGTRTSLSCGRISVGNSFFIFLVNPRLGKGNTYRASKRTTTVSLDTARAALLVNHLKSPFVFTELVDGNLVPPGVDVDMDIGITYEGADGVQVHLSPSKSGVIAFPNPATFGSAVHLTAPGIIISAQIFDETGRVVGNCHGNASAPLTEIPTQGLPSGVYNAILTSSGGTKSNVKFVIE